jgi:hypothetical protein
MVANVSLLKVGMLLSRTLLPKPSTSSQGVPPQGWNATVPHPLFSAFPPSFFSPALSVLPRHSFPSHHMLYYRNLLP